MRKGINLLIILLILFCNVSGQAITQPTALKDTLVVYEKLYLHVDREYYAPGDTLWFKSYLVSGMTHKLETGYKNVYVQLLSPKGVVIANRMYLSVYGTSHGIFP